MFSKKILKFYKNFHFVQWDPSYIGRVMCKRQLFYFIFNLHSQSCNLAELLKCIKNPAATSLIVLDIFNGYSTESRPACIRK